MCRYQSALLNKVDALKSADGGALIRRMLSMMLKETIDAKAMSMIGAGLHKPSTDRTGRPANLDTTSAGEVAGRIPKIRTGSILPTVLAPRREIDVEGVSTGQVEDLVAALGGAWFNEPKVSRICAQPEAAALRSRMRQPLEETPSTGPRYCSRSSSVSDTQGVLTAPPVGPAALQSGSGRNRKHEQAQSSTATSPTAAPLAGVPAADQRDHLEVW